MYDQLVKEEIAKEGSARDVGRVRRCHGGIWCNWHESEWAKVQSFHRVKKAKTDRYLASRWFGKLSKGVLIDG